jgi:flavin reductase (DIM6/NTAB) family NADH-FMN oxidoreductase RutF
MAPQNVMGVDSAPLDMLLKPFSTIGHDWMLITAGNGTGRTEWNTMTASWGSFGVIWNKRTVTCVIRPSRHTFKFVEREKLVTFSFFGSEMKKVLQICGSTSGIDTDKAQAASLTPLLLEAGAVGFAEAKINLVCKKLCAQDIDPASFLDEEISKLYPQGDYHRMYICEILRVYQNDTRPSY